MSKRRSSTPAERARSQRINARRGQGSPPRRKPDKAERAAMRAARTGDLRWRWPAPDAEGVRALLASMGEPPNAGRAAAYLRHDCSDYDTLVARVGRYPLALRALRLRVAQEIAKRYPPFAQAAMRAAQRETIRQQTSARRQINSRGLA